MGALFSFLGGSIFRMIWGEVSSYFKARQEHAQELERMKLQNEMEGARAERDMARLRLQSELGVKEVQIAGDLAIQKSEADAFLAAVANAAKPIGIYFVDAWNGCIRPAAATIALAVWALALYRAGFVPSDWDKELIGVVLGFYFADRTLRRHGK